MVGSWFKRRKRRRTAGGESARPEETIRSAAMGDVVVISGFSPNSEDAYFIVEKVARYESPAGKWYELTGVDGDRRVGIEWSEDDGLMISVSEQDAPMALESVGLSYDELVSMDEEQSVERQIAHDGQRYFYRTSHEVYYFGENTDKGHPFYIWECLSEDHGGILSVVKWESMPFEVYASKVISPDLVTVYKK